MLYPDNKLKFERAKGELGPSASEEDILARYVQMGGLLIQVDDPKPAPAQKPKRKKK